MRLEDFGYNDHFAAYLPEHLSPGRVIRENRERYLVSTGDKVYEAEITGNLRFSATSRSDFPAVGDWVAIMLYEPDMAIIHQVLPRKSVLQRQDVSKAGEVQVIAANVDIAFIVQSMDNNFNINRLERYMTICHSSGVEPVMTLSKTDLASRDEILAATREIGARHKDLKCILLSNVTGTGLDQISDFMQKGKTYCIMGSSGVGKTTLINNLLKKDVYRTREISTSTGKGKHTTSHRELIVLESGGILIDTPGMRELGITDDKEGLKTTFQEIHNLTLKCRFPDCRHIDEKGCAVIAALEKGEIDRSSLDNYLRMLREQEHFSSTVAEKRKKDKEFGKMAKQILKDKRKRW